ncbi:MAG: SUF system Fe-S cluster assembly protein [Alphaproteobacteria bacterium]|nr:SUF system Fe-S cluster assembly protein [Alphaproteobacteria bacterium]
MTELSRERVLEALATVTDFDRGADVVSLDMIAGLEVDGSHVRFAVEVDVRDGAAKEPLRVACEGAVRALPGVDAVTAVLTAHREPGAESADRKTDEQEALKDKVIEAIRGVYDPEIPVNIYELGLIYEIDVDPDGNVYVEMTLTAPGCPVAGSMPGEVEATVRTNVPEVGEVRVNLVWDPPWTKDRMSEAARLELGFF